MPITQQEHYGFLDYLMKYGGSAQSGGAKQGVVGGECTDHTGVLGEAGAKVSCAELKAAQEGRPTGTYRTYTTFADEPESKSKKGATKAKSAKAKSGNYAEGGYIYHYDAKKGDITILVSPKGSGATPVPRGGSAHKAILGMIESGEAKRVSDAEVKGAQAKTTPVPASVPPQDIVKKAELAAKTPFYKETWFLIGAPVTLAVILGAAIIFWPSDND